MARPKLPIDVVVPHIESREEFFQNYCLPSIYNQYLNQVIVISGSGSAPRQRNIGAAQSISEFLFFCDDDVILREGILINLYKEIGDADFAYCDYRLVGHPQGIEYHKAGTYDRDRLFQSNYISTMSLLRRSSFPGFDEKLKQLQDWDLWIRIVKAGGRGVYVPTEGFIAFYNDEGVSKVEGWERARRVIKKKHKFI